MRPKIHLAVPSSYTSETTDHKIKTYKVGLLARAAAIFNVDTIVIYRDATYDDSAFIGTVLRYMETPQYLRKLLFPRSKELRHVGVVPPLKTPHHVLTHDDVRDGVVIDVGTDHAWVEVGLDCPARMRTTGLRKGERVTVKVFSRDKPEVEAIRTTPEYRGYSVQVVASIGDALNGLVVPTSRHGEVLRPSTIERIKKRNADLLTFVFGAPHRGVEALLKDIGLSMADVSDFIVNTVPNQGTETVRIEEAIMATLSVFNIALHEKMR
ncbi:MAG: putative RNA uridine N3 methyltransferase [Halobacteriota archaeon]